MFDFETLYTNRRNKEMQMPIHTGTPPLMGRFPQIVASRGKAHIHLGGVAKKLEVGDWRSYCRHGDFRLDSVKGTSAKLTVMTPRGGLYEVVIPCRSRLTIARGRQYIEKYQ